MNLQQRLQLLNRLGEYIIQNGDNWQAAKEKAYRQNGWFTPEFIDLAAGNMANAFLDAGRLQAWVQQYQVPATQPGAKNIGIIMAGNIPLVGFHDLLCAFVSGHRQTIKTSSKDDVLIKHLVQQLYDWDAATRELIAFADMLKGCDAYIATGSNNSSRYFEYYFGKYPHIIRRNRTSVAVLSGQETTAQLEQLADDVYLYFGLGCRNVTKIYVPEGYDFVPLLESFRKYHHLADHNKYKNNYDYGLAILILNKEFYMTNESIILREHVSLFSPIAQLNYEYYGNLPELMATLKNNHDIQCITGTAAVPFGQAQQPSLTDYADGVDTLQFLLEL
jgi:hypothetical protein